MIKANELRIGNWVNIPECAINAKIKTLDSKRFAIDNSKIDLDPKDVFDYSSARPITLTPEILQKAGLKQSRGSYRMFWHLNKIEIRFWDSGLAKFIISKSHHIEVLSLHQLQNLYFALTGEELQINL